MSDARTAVGFDRLPWLADEPQPPAKRGSRGLIAWVVAAILLVAGASYWIGHAERPEPVAQTPGIPSTTVPLPEAKAPPQPEVTPDRVPEVEPAIVPTVRPAPEPQVPVAASASTAGGEEGGRSPLRARPNRRPRPSSRQRRRGEHAASADIVAVAPVGRSAGRLIQVGAFGSRYQAKRGWWAMVRAYPALKRLPTVVTESRNSKGRHFYRAADRDDLPGPFRSLVPADGEDPL